MRMTMELDLRSQPIAGWLQAEGRERQEFEGMLELMALLEALREDPAADATADQTSEPPG
jgi:hypothetical protein